MSLQTALKQLKVLSYADMMVLGEEVSKRLTQYHTGSIDAQLIAGTISRIANESTLEPTDISRQEDKILKTVFKRKRQINVEPHLGGYGLSVPTVQGSNVVGTDLRAMFPMMLDQIITLHILSKP